MFGLSGSYHFRIIISNETAYPKNSYDKQKPDTVVVQLSVKIKTLGIYSEFRLTNKDTSMEVGKSDQK